MKQKLQRLLELPPIGFAADIVRLYFSRHVSRSAAHLAYFLTLTFFPILICVSAFMGRINLRLSDLVDEVSHVLPQGVYAIFQEYLSYLDGNFSTAMFITGVFLTVLFASAAIRGLNTFNRELYGYSKPRRPRNYLYSLLFALLLLITIYLSMAVMLTGNRFFHTLGKMLGLADLADRFGVWQWLKYVILLAIVFLFVLLLYRFSVPVRRPPVPVIPGALLASGALVIASLIFAAIVGRSARYSLVYGSLASVIIMLVWLYLCGNILILGNVVNYVIDVRKRIKPV